MKYIAMADIMSAIFMAISLYSQYSYRDKSKSAKSLRVCSIFMLIWLIADAAAFSLNGPAYPKLLLGGVNFGAFTLGYIVLITFIRYCYMYITERTELKRLVLMIPAVVSVINVVVVSVMFLNGRIIAIENGYVVMRNGIPELLQLVNLLVLAYVPVVALTKRRSIGTKAVALLGMYGIVPIIAIMISILFGKDYTVSLGAVAVFVVASLLQKDDARERLEKVNAALESALVSAENANRAKTVFLSNMSHDIRTPMNAIIGFSAVAANHIDDREQVADCIEKIQSAGNHLLSLINDILDMSRIESGKATLQEEEENLSDLIHNTVNIMQAQMKAKNIDFQVEIVDVVNERVIVDAMNLNRVFINILGNSVKFTPDGRKILFSIRQKKDAPSGFASYEFRMKDEGVGMDEEFVKKIFEPFERERNVTQSGIEGSGLGMAITKNIVDMMGGVITVHSKKGEGTEFIIDMPMRLSEKEEPILEDEVLKDMQVLVIGEEDDSVDNIILMLKQIGIEADWITSPKEAVERVEQKAECGAPYQVYIVDMLMSGMNEIETIKRLRQKVDNDVPIILLSSYDWGDAAEDAQRAGVTSICLKPFFKSDLIRVLRKVNKVERTEELQEETKEEVVELTGRNILLVEDTLLNQRLATTVLEERGANVTLAKNGKEAVNTLERFPVGTFDLVFMDIMMPVMDGYEATKAIRALEREDSKTLPIIAMTANAFEDDKRNALECGMNEHIAKPFKMEILDQVLRKYLS